MKNQADKINLDNFKLAVENAYDHIVITDKDGIVLYANSAAEKITGYSKKEILGKKAGVLWGKQMDIEFYARFWNTIKNKKRKFIGEFINKRKNGQNYCAEVRISPVLDKKDNIIFFVAIERDITEEKAIDKAKSEFVSLASHQLRTPLAGMSLNTEMLLRGIAGEVKKRQKKYLKDILNGIKNMAEIIEAMLNVSRIELGVFKQDDKKLNIAAFIKSLTKEMKPQIKNKKIKISLTSGKDAPPVMINDKLARLIFENLLSNAIKYNYKEGEIEIEIGAKKNGALIKIKNTGCGIPKNQQEKIFTKLFRADNKMRSKTEGTGLGLYIAKSATERCGGKIWFESEEEKGAVFFVFLPRNSTAQPRKK